MKTNFLYLDNQIRNSHYSVETDISRYLRDLNFLLKDAEWKIYHRDLVAATYPMRMAWDLSRDFILYMIKESDNPTFSKWNDNIKASRKKRKDIANRRGEKYIDATPGYLNLWFEHPTFTQQYIKGVGTYFDTADIFKEMNSWMHYRYRRDFRESNDANNPNDDSTLFFHRNVVRYNEPTMFDITRYLETIWYVIVGVMAESGLFDEFIDYQYDFDRNIYNDPEPVMKELLKLKHIDDLVTGRVNCPICKVGRFYKPNFDELREKGVKFPHGAYLGCDTEGCWAKVDSTLKVKKELKYEVGAEADCTQSGCGSKESLQKRYALNSEENFVYLACKKCKWNNKNEFKDTDNFIEELDIESLQEDIWSDYYD